jgi:hypothetical protein
MGVEGVEWKNRLPPGLLSGETGWSAPLCPKSHTDPGGLASYHAREPAGILCADDAKKVLANKLTVTARVAPHGQNRIKDFGRQALQCPSYWQT